MNKTKPFCITKESVKAAWEKVRANKGTYGVDEESIEDFELNLKDNLYKLWNRMSSGTYFPPVAREAEIPKAGGKEVRKLGIPTVTDLIGQAVVKSYLEPIVEQKFHADSYGYRNKSALDAVGVSRQRSWQYDWCIDLDIKGFFDNLNHDLIMKAVEFHTEAKWIHLYVKRWLKAPQQMKSGEIKQRESGTPQGGVISPLLANIFMHHAFDEWMKRNFPRVRFERFADDILIHCISHCQAEEMLKKIQVRLKECNLEVYPDKTKLVYCKDQKRKGSYKNESFDFLGYTFRPRLTQNKKCKKFVGYLPAVSDRSAKRIRQEIRSWNIQLKSDKNLTDLARMFNIKVQTTLSII